MLIHLIVIPNQKLLAIAGERTPLLDTFKKADEVLLQACQGIADLINIRGLINLDFADIKTVMANKGMALMGTGQASGENRAVEAATAAISSPLLENVSIDGATGIIINVTGGPDLTMFEVNEASTLITEAAHEDAEIIFGAVIDDTIRDEVRVTVIATGFGRDEKTTFAEQVSQMHAMSNAENVAPVQSAPQPQHSMPASWPQPPTIRPIANGLPPIPQSPMTMAQKWLRRLNKLKCLRPKSKVCRSQFCLEIFYLRKRELSERFKALAAIRRNALSLSIEHARKS